MAALQWDARIAATKKMLHAAVFSMPKLAPFEDMVHQFTPLQSTRLDVFRFVQIASELKTMIDGFLATSAAGSAVPVHETVKYAFCVRCWFGL